VESNEVFQSTRARMRNAFMMTDDEEFIFGLKKGNGLRIRNNQMGDCLLKPKTLGGHMGRTRVSD
jgi:hypothetical protein